MKKLFLMLFAFALLLSTIGCSDSFYYEDRYEEGYDDGYYAGVEDGIEDGFDYGYDEAAYIAPERIATRVIDDFSDLSSDIKERHGMYPGDAFNLIENYADGEPIPEDELIEAFWAAAEYYYGSQDIIYEIEEYSID